MRGKWEKKKKKKRWRELFFCFFFFVEEAWRGENVTQSTPVYGGTALAASPATHRVLSLNKRALSDVDLCIFVKNEFKDPPL